MACSSDYRATFTAFIFIILCTKTYIFASEGDIYTVEDRRSELKFHDLSVIDYQQYARHRRETAGDNANGTTAKPMPPTTSPNLLEMNLIHVDYQYYESLMFKPADLDQYWVELKDVQGHTTLSDSHRTAVTAKLPFRFPFYGHYIDNVTIATGGFLYMSPFIHKFLTATQYIAPLMANFDTKSGGRQSTVIYKNVANKFVVEWRDVHLKDQNGRSTEGTGAFKFQAVLHINGSISFIYKALPIPIVNISSTEHPVKIGLSDAFYFDTTAFGTKRRTIYEYHRVALNTTFIDEGTIVLMNPQPTCNRYTDCETCVTAKIDFDCKWCGIISKCSDSVDWHRQEWLNSGCVQHSNNNISTCLLETTTTTATTATGLDTKTSPTITTRAESQTSLTGSQIESTGNPIITWPHLTLRPCSYWSGSGNCSSIPTAKTPEKQKAENGMGTQIGIIVVVVVIVVVLIGAIGGWFYYAYTHPTSASGMWLMEHRPSQMKAKMSNMKFWRRNGTAGDKYAVESTA